MCYNNFKYFLQMDSDYSSKTTHSQPAKFQENKNNKNPVFPHMDNFRLANSKNKV